MAYVRIYFHRDPRRLAPHVRYIAGRENSRGLRGLGPAFRALRGDVPRSIALLRDHTTAARTRAGSHTREGPFVRLLFTLPDSLANRVQALDHARVGSSQQAIQDAVEATFRSAGRHLQGVYAIHFHSTGRHAHPHVHVDLSPLDLHGRTVFLTARLRDTLRAAWDREVVRAIDRFERRARTPPHTSREPALIPTPTVTKSDPLDNIPPATSSPHRSRPAQPRSTLRAASVLASIVLGHSSMPLVDLFTHALLARGRARLRVPLSSAAVRLGVGLDVPTPSPLPGLARLVRIAALRAPRTR